MQSGTSFFDWTIFKKTVCRFWPLWGVYSVIWLVMMPLNGLMLLRMDSSNRAAFASYDGGYMVNFGSLTVPHYVHAAMILAVVFGALAAMAVLSHLYNARSANLFGSLPVRREGLFLTHYLAGLCFLVVPNVVIFLLTLLVEAAGGSVCMEGLLLWLAASCGECFFFYSMAVFCGMFTGHILALPAFYGIFNALAVGIVGLVQLLCHGFYYGFCYTQMPEAVVWLTPVAKLGASVDSYWETPAFDTLDEALAGAQAGNTGHLNTYGWGTLGIYAAAALALAVCAFFLYRARRLESAGDVVSVNAMKPVFKYGVALCAGLAFGVGTRMVISGGEKTLMVAIVAWGVIGYFAAQMLLDKSFRVFHKWKGAAAVAAVFIAVFVVVAFDLTGFETRVPDPASVQEVHVRTGNAVYLDDGGDYLDLNVTDPEVIKLLNVLHREAVAQRDEEWRRQNMVGDGTSVSLDLDYTLQGGGRMSRRYSVWLKLSEVDQEGTAAWAVQRLYDSHELYWEAYGFAGLEQALAEGARLDSVMFDAYVGDYTAVGDVVGYGKDAQALLAAVKEDFFAGRIGVRRLDDREHWNGGSREASLYFTATDPVRGQGAYRVSITLQKTASSTIAELRRLEASLDNDQIRDAFEEWLK